MNVKQTGIDSIANLLNSKRVDSSLVSFEQSLGNQQSSMTWADFQSDVRHYAKQLTDSSATRVALCFSNSYLFAVGFFASCYANKSLVLPGNYQTQSLKELSVHFDLLLHDSDIATNIATISDLDSLEVSSLPHSNSATDFSPLDLAQVNITLFTSGSSGKAKAISKTLQQLDSEIAILEHLWGATLADCRIQSTVSHMHIYGLLFRLLWPLCAARPFATYNLEFPEQVIAHANQQTALISSPALLKRLHTHLVEKTNSTPFAAVFSSGGPLPEKAAKDSFQLFGGLPIEVFGSTETGGIAFRQQQTPTTPWQLFPGVVAELNGENCLRLRAPHIAGKQWYQTADECLLHDKSSFDLKGRTDRVVKIEEKRVSLVEVEKRLEQLNWIEESATIAMQQGHRLTICAVLVLTATGIEEVERLGKGKFWIALRTQLRDWLEPVAIPRKYRLVSEIPLNSQGKRQVDDIKTLFQA
ncbi:AMP-fatty acid ligase [Vibrio sp. UCD-FRSSP16_10]|uniref:AMP-binding protein n=1 Tax=unclassified Vibrio TaxID=2614977 RepID=UPI0007FBB727|nr:MULTISPECIES: AMP-binding protein [unclassified Vibrio]OBT14775.1 AMP-fatty acid ligase [Vibrio sp. UCD-FRSSP16_30]OBT20064.1 AMP-fatty acid ligase [Vibrio sp. UCD-FRSSP16_10]